MEPGHSLLKRRKWFKVFALRIKFPILNFPAVVGNYRIPRVDSTLLIKKFQFAAFCLIQGEYIPHEMINILLPVFVTRYCGTYGNNLTQNVSFLTILQNK